MLKLYGTDRTFLSYLMRYKDYHIEKDLETADSLLYLTYCGKNTKIKNECYVRTDDAYYVVKEVRPSDDGADIVCQLDLEDLERSVFDQFTADDKTITEAANLALAGTGWTVSTTITKKRSVQTFNARPRQILEKIRDAFMCELQYDNVNKIVTFKEEFGEYKGVYFRRDLNLKKLSTTIDSYDYYTRIIPIGADGLTIKSVNNNIEYLDNFQYSNKVKVFVWEDTSYEDASKLKEDAALKLADMSKPKTSYSADIIDLAKRSHTYDLLSFELGDAIDLIDELSGVNDRQRIVKTNIYPDEPERNTCEISNTVLTFEELQSRLDKAAAAWEEKSNTDGTIKGIYVHGVQADDVVYIETEQGQTVKTDVQTTLAGISGTVSNINLRVGTIEASYVTTTYLTTNYLTAQDISTTYLSASVAALTYATITSLQADEARIGTIEANYISSSAVAAGYAQISLANIDTANISKAKIKDLFVEVGLITDAVITSGKITGYLDAVNVNAANITAGTLSTDRLVIRGTTESIVYELNNITGALQSQNVNTLNGEVITQRTINADRIVAGTITANEIATGTITASKINVADLFAQTITATGSITGATLYGSHVEADSGEIAGFTIDLGLLYYNDDEPGLGNVILSPGGLTSSEQVGPSSGSITWVFTVNSGFGVDENGDVYVSQTYAERIDCAYEVVDDLFSNNATKHIGTVITGGDVSVVSFSGETDFVPDRSILQVETFSSARSAYCTFELAYVHDATGEVQIDPGDSPYFKINWITFDMAGPSVVFYSGDETQPDEAPNQTIYIDGYGGIIYADSFEPMSDRRLKENIGQISDSLGFIMSLNPQQFVYKASKDRRFRYGFIAQDVIAEADKRNLALYSMRENKYALSYLDIIAPHIAVTQDHERRITALENKLL